MTFHTFELSAKLSGQLFKDINIEFKKYGSQYFRDAHNGHRKIFIGLRDYGIEIYLYRREFYNDGFVYYLSYRINPIRILNGTDYENLFHSNNAAMVCDMVDKHLESVSHSLPKMEECILQRFDFCSNIVFDSMEMVKDFIRLINASYVPNDEFTQKLKHDTRSGRDITPREEATFTRMDYVEVSFYNKIKQLKSERLPMEWHENILRCEIRCKKRFIDNLKRKFNLYTIEDFFNALPEIGTYVYVNQLKKLSLAYKYFHLDELCDIIDNTTLKSKTKKKMKAFAEAAARHKGIVNAMIKELVPDAGKIIRRFSELDICPMPLPYRLNIESGTNLLELCLRFADNKHL